MGGLASSELAVAVARAGGLGMLSGAAGAQALSAQLDTVPSGLVVGVNFLIPFLDRLAVEDASARSSYVEFFWGSPDAGLVASVHHGGALAGWQVGSTQEARAAAEAGCDVIVAQGIEAGGHVRGTVGLLALVEEVRQSVELPLVAAGGIGSGRAMAAALVAGGDAIGTRFVAADECCAHRDYVDALIRSGADDTVLTTAFGLGWPDAPHRVLRSSVAAGQARGEMQSWAPDWPSTDTEGPIEAKALYAGQSVGSVRSRQGAAAIVEEIIRDAETVLLGMPEWLQGRGR